MGQLNFSDKKRARRGGPDCEVGCKGPSFLFPRYMYLRATTDEEDCANTYCLSSFSGRGVAAPMTQAREIQYTTTHNGRTTRQKISLIKKKDPERSARILFCTQNSFLWLYLCAQHYLSTSEKRGRKTHYRTQLSSQCVQSPNSPPMTPSPQNEPYST